MQTRIVRAGWGIVLSLGVAAACGGNTKDGAPIAALEPTAGAAGTGSERAELPYFSCDKFGLEVVAPMAPDACPNVGCDCWPSSLPVRDGCLTEANCANVCDPASEDEWISCLFVYYSCVDDADCSAGKRCFVPPDNDHGLCGDPQQDCIADADCAGGSFCVAVRADGKRRCVVPADQSSCNSDEQCAGGRCIFFEPSAVGLCTTGGSRSRCQTDGDCESGLACGATVCTDGQRESSCDSDDDCRSHSCRWETCVDGRNEDFCDRDSDCQSGVCVRNIRCSDGELDQSCEFESDCLSGVCAISSPYAQCVDGAPGSKCGDDADCISGACRRDIELRPGDYFGRCD